MSNLEKWKAAKDAWWAKEREYATARRIVTEAGAKRSAAWEYAVVAAQALSPDEKMLAAEYEFGPLVPAGNQGDAA